MVIMLRFDLSVFSRAGGAFGFVFSSHQLAAKELANRRFRYIAHEKVTARTFEFGKAGGLAKLIELNFLDGLAALDESGDHLAPALVREADDSNFRHSRMERQAAFDFDGRDVLAAADDHVINPARDEKIAVRIEIAGIAGEIPADRGSPWHRLPAAANSLRMLRRL